jgi:hypothetical protein
MATKRISALTAAGSAALADQIPIENASNATRKLTLTQVFALADDQNWTWAGTHAFGAAVTMGSTLGVTGAVTLASTLAVTGASTLTGAVALASTLGVTGVATFGTTPVGLSTQAIGARKVHTSNVGDVYLASIFESIANPTADTASGYRGVYATAETETANAFNFTSSIGLRGIDSRIAHKGSGTVTGATAFYVGPANNTGGGTITNAYGIYMDTQTAATNNWALFTAGTARSQFGGTAPDYTSAGRFQLGARQDFTDTSGSTAAGAFQTNPAPASASSAIYNGVAGYLNNTSANTASASLYGGSFDARTTTAVASLIGSVNRARFNGAGTLAAGVGAVVTSDNNSTGTVTVATALSAQGSNSGGGTIGTFYGVRVPVSANLATNTWGVYVDSAPSFFGGSIRTGALPNDVTATAFGTSARSAPADTSGITAASVAENNPTPGSASTAGYHGVYSHVNNTSAHTSGAYLHSVVANAKSSTPVVQMIGVIARTINSGTGTQPSNFAAYLENQMTAAGTVTTTTGAFITASNAGGGTMGSYFGLRVNTPAGLASTMWGVHVDALNSYFGGDVHIGVAGKGLRIKEGSNAKMGVSTLSAGSVVVANTSVTATSRIFLTGQSDGGTPGAVRVSARTPGVSFTITSSSGADTSVIAWEIKEPA